MDLMHRIIFGANTDAVHSAATVKKGTCVKGCLGIYMHVAFFFALSYVHLCLCTAQEGAQDNDNVDATVVPMGSSLSTAGIMGSTLRPASSAQVCIYSFIHYTLSNP